MERTLVLIKPDGIQRNLAGIIISRLENRGLKMVAAKFTLVSLDLAQKHYKMHLEKPFYEGLIRYITSSPCLAIVWEGPDAIQAVRQTMGATNPLVADPGTIRHDYALATSRNLTHASDSFESAEIEINNWFSPQEIFNWDRHHEDWFTGLN